ncbi:hypothetical protein QK289_13120 [Exiguobacterium antarcticum]|uniref:Uncharacterized protein n=1 Tax=Exiguobacterium antarcticum TaxID=132920 RepID=A0ABT6R4U0_9BACL|nr:hypothetical protein [Exiguobacterium antarcticum]MDI3235951.1 hypothetical protein [Exiguobacterium antarcticum]
MSNKDRKLAGFDDVAKNPNDNTNNSENIKSNTLKEIINTKKSNTVYTGVYIEEDLSKLLNSFQQRGQRGVKSATVNHALRELFKKEGYL